jgi:putative ABC transport system permease protein
VTSPPARILIRNLARRPVRLAMSVLSIALAVTVLVSGRYFEDTMGLVMDIHFRSVERQQATVQFSLPIDARVGYDLRHLPGVLRVEPFRAAPARIRFGSRVERTLIFGLRADAELRRIVGKSRRVAPPPSQGVVLTDFLARTLGARTGDLVTIEVLEGRRAVRETQVVGEIDELIGTYAYMELGALLRLVDEEAFSGAYLSVDPQKELAFDRALKGVPAVSGVSMREAAIRNYEESISDIFGTFTMTLILLSAVVAVGVVYNGARIALFERGRELASLRVLGFTRQEVAAMLFGEQAIIIALGIPLGFLMGYGLSALVSLAYQNKLIRMPLLITPASYAFSFLVIVAAAALSGLIVKRRADRLDLVAVLKTRE